MIVAGEPSGDQLGADLARELITLVPDVKLFGTPGQKMRSTGVESLMDSDDWSVVGLGAVAFSVPKFLSIKKALVNAANERKPSAVVLIDFPEFNLKLAGALKNRGHHVVYYVSPQVWAWRQYRIKSIRKNVDLLLSILPFESEWYRTLGIENVKYVGNPVAKRTQATLSRSDFCKKYDLEEDRTVVAVLPGSRLKEIKRHLPTMLDAALILHTQKPDIQFVVAAAPQTKESITKIASSFLEKPESRSLTVRIVDGDAINALAAADTAAVSSGTATLEAGVIGTPMAVVYKLPKLDYAIFSRIVKTPHIALINLISGDSLVKELIQDDFNARNLANELLRLIEPTTNANMREQLRAATERLNIGDPSRTAAEAILEFIQSGAEGT